MKQYAKLTDKKSEDKTDSTYLTFILQTSRDFKSERTETVLFLCFSGQRL